MSFNPNPSSLPPNKEDRAQILNATLSFLSSNPCTLFPLSSPSNLSIKAIKTHSLSGSLLVNLLNASPVDFPMNSSDNKPPALTPWFPRFKKPDPLVNRQNGAENNPVKQELDTSLGLNNLLLPINKTFVSPAAEGFTRLKDENIKSHDVDFWLVFEKKHVKQSLENFLEDLKNQFESINIVKIKQFYYLEKNSDIHVTGWKLFDETLVYDIINQTKKLLLTSSSLVLPLHSSNPPQDQKLDFQIIQSAADLRKHLRKVALDKKLEELGLFNGEFAKPLLKLQMQGLSYYEFDYADLCPETLCVLCGLPPTTTDDELLDCFTHHVLPSTGKNSPYLTLQEPISILRNPTSEGPTTIRGLKVPVEGEFQCKPLIIIPVKNRNFDYLSELVKFQVKIEFEKESKLDITTLVNYMKELEARYGPLSDINMIGETGCVVSFVQMSSAGKCLDMAKFEKFSLKAEISKPSQAYPCTGYLFQNGLENARNNISIQRPPALVKADPAQLKIPSKFFEKKLILKKRYQKIYLVQQEEAKKKSSQNPEKTEENSPSFTDFNYEQILTEGLNPETDHHHHQNITEISSSLIETVQKTAKELIAEITKPSSITGKRPFPSEEIDDVPEPEEEDEVPEPKIEQEDDDFEDFHIKILQPITDDSDGHYPKIEEHDQSTEIEQNESKIIEQASKPTKKLKTESRVSPKIKLENKLKSRSSSKTKGASSRTGKYTKKGVYVSQKMQVEDNTLEETLPTIQPKRSERLALKADKRKVKIYASLLKSNKKKMIKPKRKAIAKTKKRTQKRGPIEDGLYTRENPLIKFMLNNFVKNEEEKEEEKINIKNEDIRNLKIEVKKELIEEEFGMPIEIYIPDMKALFLPRELRQVKVISSKYMIKRPKQQFKQSEAKKAVETEDKTKLLIQQNIEKIRNLIEINQDIRRKKQAQEKNTKIKYEA